MRVIVFGDSIAQGYHDTNGGWVGRLQNYVLKNQKDASIFNLGISGDKVEHVVKRFKHETEARTKRWDSFDDSVIILAVGTNDTYKQGKNPDSVTDKSAFVTDFSRLIDMAKVEAKYVFICSILPVDELRSTPVSWEDISYFNETIDSYNVSIQNLCSEKEVKYLDLNSEAKKIGWASMIDDGTHPNTDGHDWLFQQIQRYIADLLQK